MSIPKKKSNADKSFEKLKAYFLTITKERPFLDRVVQIRIACGIPPEGYMDPDPTIDTARTHILKEEIRVKLNNETTKLAKEYNLNLPFWEDLFRDFITDSDFNIEHASGRTYIKLRDVPEDSQGRVGNDIWEEYSSAEDVFYPIHLMLHPNTTRRELEAYIKKHWSKRIKPTLDRYKNPDNRTNKYRAKDMSKIYDFIYSYRDKPYSEIRKRVRESHKVDYDTGEIGKIISIEKKRRREV